MSSASKHWDNVYDDIYDIYWVQDQTLKETMCIMKTEHNFSATEKQWVSQLLKWGLKKNVGSKEMANIVRIQQKRKAQYDKDTNFTVRGRHVSQDNIDRWQKRQKVDEQPQTVNVTTPSDISYDTPSEIAPTPPQTNITIEDAFETSHSTVLTHLSQIETPNQDSYQATADAMDIDSPAPSYESRSRMDEDPDYDSDGTASITEISRDEMYSSDSSNSSVATIKADEYSTAVRDFGSLNIPQSAPQGEKEKSLRAAARKGNAQLVQRLIQSGANIESRSKSGMTALHAASFFGHVNVISLLLDNGADIECEVFGIVSIPYLSPSGKRMLEDLDDACSIHLAVSRGHFAATKCLLDGGADPCAPICESSAFLWAIKLGFTSIAQHLVERDHRLQSTTWLDPALVQATQYGHTAIVQWLLNKGANSESRSLHGETAIGIAVRGGHADIVHLFIKSNVGPHQIDLNGETPLAIAAAEGHTNVIQVLLDNGADPNFRFPFSGHLPLICAARSGHYDTTELLLKRGSNPNMIDNRGYIRTALAHAVEEGFTDIVQLLLNKGADPNLMDTFPPLMLAALNGCAVSTRLLLENKADPNIQDKAGNTALVYAASHGYMDVVHLLLLNSSVDVNLMNSDGCTALAKAAIMGQTDIVRLLLENGVDPDKKDSEGETALSHAVLKRRLVTARVLLAGGASVKTLNIYGCGPLDLAVLIEGPSGALVRLLREYGATLSQRTEHWVTYCNMDLRTAAVSFAIFWFE